MTLVFTMFGLNKVRYYGKKKMTVAMANEICLVTLLPKDKE